MSIKNSLLDIFEKALSKNCPEIPASGMKSLLKQALEKRKYDTQDEAIVEALLNDKEKPLEESFIESLQRYMNKIESENDFLGTEERQEEIVEIFIFDLEKLIDYFYNALLNKHFT